MPRRAGRSRRGWTRTPRSVAAICSRYRVRGWSGRCAGTGTGCGSWVARSRRRWRGSAVCGRASWRCPTRRRWCSSPRGERRGRCRWPEFATRVWRWIGDEESMTANTSDVVSAIRELTNTKQLERTELLDLLKDGLHAALVKRYGPNVRAEIGIDELKGTIRIAVLRTVVEAVEDPGSQVTLEEARFEDSDFQVGDVLEEDVPFEAFGRTAVQAAKQRIIQRVREGERARIREEFTDKVGELLSGEVQQIERGKIVVMLAKFREAEAIIPYREQNHREHFHQGDTIRAVLKRIEETPKGPRLILSRADPLFVKALFKLEVPEIQQQIVEIRATAREAGSRTKIAVSSRDDSIDPVGACVGLKGSRVQAVVNELNGERIDIVPWSPDPERFAKLSLAPARVARVFSDPDTKTIQAIVDEDQLSLAIGRNGQNVRLASELTGWKIDLYSSREWLERGGEGPLFAPLPPAEDEAATKVSLRELKGLPVELVDVLERAGHKTLQDILDLEREDVDKITGMTPEIADKLMAFLNEMTEEGGDDEAAPGRVGDTTGASEGSGEGGGSDAGSGGGGGGEGGEGGGGGGGARRRPRRERSAGPVAGTGRPRWWRAGGDRGERRAGAAATGRPVVRRARGGREPAHPREGRAPGAGTARAGADGSGGGAVGGGAGTAAGAGRRRGGCRAGTWVGRVFGGVSDDDADSRSGG